MGNVVSSRVVVWGTDWLREDVVSVTVPETSENVGCEIETVVPIEGC